MCWVTSVPHSQQNNVNHKGSEADTRDWSLQALFCVGYKEPHSCLKLTSQFHIKHLWDCFASSHTNGCLLQVFHVLLFFNVHYYFSSLGRWFGSGPVCVSPPEDSSLNVILLSCCCRLQVNLVCCRTTVNGFSQNCYVKRVSCSPGQQSESPSSSEMRNIPPLLCWLASCVLWWCHDKDWRFFYTSCEVLAPPSKVTFQPLLFFLLQNKKVVASVVNSGLSGFLDRFVFFFMGWKIKIRFKFPSDCCERWHGWLLHMNAAAGFDHNHTVAALVDILSNTQTREIFHSGTILFSANAALRTAEPKMRT